MSTIRDQRSEAQVLEDNPGKTTGARSTELGYTARSPKSVRTLDHSQLHVCELQIDQYLLQSDFLVNHRKAY